MTLQNNKALVTQSNALIGASYRVSLAEKRILLFMLAQIHKDDEDFKPYKINLKDFIHEIKASSKNMYQVAQEATESLLSRVLTIKKENSLLQVNFLSSAEYEDGKGFVELCFDPKLKPFLLQLKECFTTYDIRNVMALRSVHAIRVYELLKQYQPLGERTIAVDELKEILGVDDKYKDYGPFKLRVLMQAQKDLTANCDLTFDFEEIKESRKVSRIKFKIRKNEKKEKDELDLMVDPKKVIFRELVDLGIDKKQAINYLQIKDLRQLQETIDYAKKQHGLNKVHTNLGGYVKSLIDKDAQAKAPYEAKEEEIKFEEKKALDEERKQIESLREDFFNYRTERIDEALNQMSQEEKDNFFNSLTGFQRAVIFDEKGRLKEKTAYSFLKVHLSKQLKLEDNDEIFQRWAFEEKGLVLRKVIRRGAEEWAIELQQTRLI